MTYAHCTSGPQLRQLRFCHTLSTCNPVYSAGCRVCCPKHRSHMALTFCKQVLIPPDYLVSSCTLNTYWQQVLKYLCRIHQGGELLIGRDGYCHPAAGEARQGHHRIDYGGQTSPRGMVERRRFSPRTQIRKDMAAAPR